MARLYLDCDGVLADFDKGAAAVFGMRPRDYERRHGLGRFWKALANAPGFFENLPLMPDAIELYRGLRHLEPAILTGCPRGGWAEAQKERWVARHFPEARIITCFAAQKRRYCHPGDILIDDSVKYRYLWEEAGGVFILHRSARQSLIEFERLMPGSIRVEAGTF